METIEKEYKTDPFSFVFRELDIVHREITELKADIREINKHLDDVNKRIDETNKRIDDLSKDMTRRFDKLYTLIIVTFIGTIGSLVKLLFF